METKKILGEEEEQEGGETRIGNNLFLSFSSKVNQIELLLYEFCTPPPSAPIPFITTVSAPPGSITISK